MSDLQTLLAEIRRKKTCELREFALVRDAFLSIPPHRVGILHLALVKRFLLADPTGCGKTPQALVAYAYLREKDPSLRCLVVTIKGALFQWQGSVEKFLRETPAAVPGYSARNAKTSAASRHQQWVEDRTPVLITTYQTLARDAELLLPTLDNYVLVLDEVQTVGNAQQGVLFPAAQKLSLKAHYCWGLSATPLMKRLENLFAIFEVIWPGLLGGSLTAFRHTYLDETLIRPKGGGRPFWKVTGHKNLDQLKRIIEPYRLMRPAAEIDQYLPPVVLKQTTLTMPPKQRALYDQIIAKILPLAAGGESDLVSPLGELSKPHANRTRAKKVAPSPSATIDEFGPDFDQGLDRLVAEFQGALTGPRTRPLSQFASLTYAQLAADAPAVLGFADVPSVKGQELVRFLTEECSNGEKVVVYSKFEKVVTWICSLLQEAGITHARITGKEPAGAREASRRRFQTAADPQVMVITDAGGQALDLQAAGIVVFFDLPWIWGSVVQIIGRTRRVGTRHSKVLAVLLTADHSIDSKVIEHLNSTEELAAQLLMLTDDDRVFASLTDTDASNPEIPNIPSSSTRTTTTSTSEINSPDKKQRASALFFSVLSDLQSPVQTAELKIPIP